MVHLTDVTEVYEMNGMRPVTSNEAPVATQTCLSFLNQLSEKVMRDLVNKPLVKIYGQLKTLV